MKNFKKVIALIIVAVMALSLNTFALNISFDETVSSAPVTYVDSNDEYMCIHCPDEGYEGKVNCVVNVYKNIDGKWTYFAKVISTLAGVHWFTVGGISVTENNKLVMRMIPSDGSGMYYIADVNLYNLTQGQVLVDVDGLYRDIRYIPDDTYIDGFQVIGDKIWITREDWGGRIIAFNYIGSQDLHDFYWSHMLDGWSTTADRNYTYKINDAGNCEIYDANAWRTLTGDYIDYTDLKWTVQVPEAGIAAIQVSGNYLTVVSGNNVVYGYKLAGEAVDGVLPYTQISSIYGTYGSMDMFDKYAAVYSQSGQKLYVFNIDTCETENVFEVPSATENGAHVEFNESGVAVAHVNGGIDVYNVNCLTMNIDPENYNYTVDENGEDVVAANIEFKNKTKGLVSGNVIFASYEGNKLMGVSVKPLDVAVGATVPVTTGYVPVSKTATTTFKAFYLSSAWAPLMDIPVEYSSFFGGAEKTDSYYEYIYRLTKSEIIPAKPGGVYVPDAEITKAEFVAMLVKAFKLTVPAGDTGFSDVPETAWYAEAAAAAKNAGLEEYSDKFAPNEIMTYEKAISMIKVLLPESQITATGDTLDCKNAAKLIFKACEIQNRTSYYVNPETGDDVNDGTEEAPFKTLTKAKETIAAVNKEMQNDLYVYMGGGDYFTYEPIKFTSADSGMNGHRIYYKNLPGEKPVMQAGVPVSGWEIHDAEKNIYKAPAKGSKSRQLYVNGTRAVRARSEGEFTNAKFTSDGFECDNTELADFKEIQNMEIAWKTKWMLQRGHVDSVTVENGKCRVKMKKSFWNENQYNGGNGKITGTPSWYENAYELLDSPGEFYLSLKDDMFYYMPREGEDINEIKAYSGTDTDIINIISDSYANPFKNVTFDGIEFRGTTWLYASEHGINDEQNSVWKRFSHAIYAERMENVDIINCRFENLGGEGIELIYGIKNVNITGNRFYDISAHAIWVGEYTAIPSNQNLWDENIKISNNYIEKAGCEYMSAVPLVAGFLKDSEITHNEIFDVPYSGMHIGYGWGAITESNTKNMLIAYNYIHEVMHTLHDGGAIYCLGGTGGSLNNPNRIYRNYIVNQYSATSVIYTDEGSNYWRVHENVQDMTEGQKSWAPQYGSTWHNTCHDCVYEDNYVMIDRYQNGGTRCIYRNTKVYPDANWDDEPLAIMQNAGLEPRYAHLSPSSEDKEIRKFVMANEPDIKTGEKINLNARAITKSGDFVDLLDAKIRYYVDNPEIATVSENGIVTGLKRGKTKVYAQLMLDGKTMTRENTVYVDDEFGEIIPTTKYRPAIIVGEQKTGYAVTGRSLLGRVMEIDEVTLSSSNPEALEVRQDGTIIAKKRGEAAVVVKAKVKNMEKTQSFTMNVIDYAEPDVPEYTPYSTLEMFKSPTSWEKRYGAALTSVGANTMRFATPTGQVTYKKQKFENEIFKFDLAISGAKNWPAITLRNRSTTENYGDWCYMIDFIQGGIELQRWNNYNRTAIFCNLQDTRVGTHVPLNTYGGEIEVGTITEENGVRIILKIDGETIINYLDRDEDRITEPGYFGIMTEDSFFTITGK